MPRTSSTTLWEIKLSTQIILASAEAAAAKLPSAMRIALSARDLNIVDIAVTPFFKTVQRLCVLFDDDRDIRIFHVLAALYLQRKDLCLHLVGLGESQGRVHAWFTTVAQERKAEIQPALAHACTEALYPYDRWQAAEPHFILTLPNGQIIRSSLPSQHPLLLAPERYTLGRVCS
jgi:hypothetical protein